MSTTGIGRRLKSVRTPRAALTPMPIGTRYIVSRRWFFPVAADSLAGTSDGGGTTTGALTLIVSTPSAPQRGAMALTQSGWAGAVSITVGGSSVSITPKPRTSSAEVLSRLILDAANELGGTWSWYYTNDGEPVIRGPAAFDLAATLTTATRLGLTGTYSGSSAYVADAAASDVYLPVYGLRVGAHLSPAEGRAVASGAYGTTGPAPAGRGSLTLWTTHADAWTAETSLSGTYDVVLDGRLLGRWMVHRVTRTAPGRLRTGMVGLLAEAMAVSQ